MPRTITGADPTSTHATCACQRPRRIGRGGFWADGAHGQFMVVDPANDLVAVHQTNGDTVSDRQKGHLMWLIQTAARVPDPGSDPGNDLGGGTGRTGRRGRARL